MRITTVFTTLFFMWPIVVLSHEGETHSAPEILSLPATGTQLLTLSVTTEQFEAVVKYSKTATYADVPLTLFLSDVATNAPIGGAQIELQIPDTEINLLMNPTDVPGIYQARLALPRSGNYNLIFSISAGDLMDLMVINDLVLADVVPKSDAQYGPLWLLGLGLVLGILIFIGVAKYRGQR